MYTETSASDLRSSRVLTGISVFLICFAALFFEITFPRLLLFIRYYNAITIIPIAMLGIGAGAVFSYILGRNRVTHLLFLILFPLSVFFSFYVLVFRDEKLLIILSAASVFFTSSVLITYFFITGRSSKIYFYDLAGAGLGVAASFFIFPMLGGENCILMSAFIASAAGVAASFNSASFKRFRYLAPVLPVLLFIAVTGIFVYNLSTDKIDIIKLMPLSNKGSRDPLLTTHGILKDPNNKHLYKKWSLVSRVDAVETTKSLWDSPYKGKRIYLYQNDLYFSYVPVSDIAHYQQPAYQIYKDPKALIIGSGGGVDIAIARGNTTKKVTGVEIDPAIVNIMRDELNRTSANVYGKADIHVIDGRAFVKRAKNEYDVILMNFTDLNIAFPNSQVFMEYYLYTVEALQDYLNALTDNGLVYINKWVSVGKGMKPELLRLTATAMEALEKSGYKEPRRHLLVAAENPKTTVVFPGAIRGFLLMKKSPFTPAEIAVINNSIKDTHTIMYPTAERIDGNPFPSVILSKNREEMIKGFRNDIHPTYDDKPYFNEFDKTHRFSKDVASDFIRLLLFMIAIPVVLVFLLDRNLRRVKTPLYLLFFASTGFSFMMFETYLIQKFNLVLGSPIYSITFTIGTILLAAGTGGFFSGRFSNRISMILVAVIPFALVGYYFLIKNFSGHLLMLPLTWRIILSGFMLFPLFFLLGIPFPSAMAKAKDLFSARSAGIMYAVDASCATLAVVSSIYLSMTYGFSFLFLIAAAGYIITVTLYLLLSWRS